MDSEWCQRKSRDRVEWTHRSITAKYCTRESHSWKFVAEIIDGGAASIHWSSSRYCSFDFIHALLQFINSLAFPESKEWKKQLWSLSFLLPPLLAEPVLIIMYAIYVLLMRAFIRGSLILIAAPEQEASYFFRLIVESLCIRFSF